MAAISDATQRKNKKKAGSTGSVRKKFVKNFLC